jgi:hypothetical protein
VGSECLTGLRRGDEDERRGTFSHRSRRRRFHGAG